MIEVEPTRHDRDLVSGIDMSERQVAEIIGKSRQAVNYGLQKEDKPLYFKDNELSNLYLFCKVRDKISADKIRRHVLNTRTKNAKAILSINGLFLTSVDLNNAAVVVALVPDFRYFMLQHPNQSNLFLKRAKASSKSFLIATSVRSDAQEFWSTVFPNTKSTDLAEFPYVVDPIINAMPYTVFLDHDMIGGGSCWVHGTGGFQKQDKMRSHAMFKFITDRESLPVDFQYQGQKNSA